MLDDILLWWSWCVTYSECSAFKFIPGINLLAELQHTVSGCLFIFVYGLTSSVTAGGPLISNVCLCILTPSGDTRSVSSAT